MAIMAIMVVAIVIKLSVLKSGSSKSTLIRPGWFEILDRINRSDYERRTAYIYYLSWLQF